MSEFLGQDHRSVEFFETVVGFAPLRVQEFRDKKVFFPSVRVSDDTIFDLMARAVAPMLNAKVGTIIHERTAGSAGHLVNHVCFAMSKDEYDALQGRLEKHGVPMGGAMQQSFGARGLAPHTFYFADPDGNVFEARYYAE